MALKLHPTPQAGLKVGYLELCAIQDLLMVICYEYFYK